MNQSKDNWNGDKELHLITGSNSRHKDTRVQNSTTYSPGPPPLPSRGDNIRTSREVKRKITKPTSKGRYKSKIPTKRLITALILLIFANRLKVMHPLTSLFHFENQITALKAIDDANDEFEECIPVYNENGELVCTTSVGSLMFYNGTLPNDDQSLEEKFEISCTDSKTGETHRGYVYGKYMEPINHTFSKEELEKYNVIYEINNKGKDVNFRVSPEKNSNNIIEKLPDGTYIIGNSKFLSSEDDKITWIDAIYITSEGEIIKGYIDSCYAKKVENVLIVGDTNIMSQKGKKVMEVHTDGVPLRLRSTRDISSDDNILHEIPDKSIIYDSGEEPVEEISNGIIWTKVEYPSKEGIIEGWVASQYLKEATILQKYVKEGISLNVRSKPGKESRIISKFEAGTELQIPKRNLENALFIDGEYWVKITLPEGYEGYVAVQYLQSVKKDEHEGNEEEINRINDIMDRTTVTTNGDVVGIDVGFITGDELEKILDNFSLIGNTTYRENDGDYDTTEYSGKVNYCYFGMGATSYTSDKIYPREHLLECIKKCEERNIPYGTYFLSTSTDKKQADKEIEYIKKCMEEIAKLNPKYNRLPFALDRESGPSNIEGVKLPSGEDTTEITSYLVRRLNEIFGRNICIYGSLRDIYNKDTRIFNLDKVREQSCDVDLPIWLVHHRYPDGSIPNQEAYNDMKKKNNVIVEQTIIDGEVTTDEKSGEKKKIDIDIMNLETFRNLILEYGKKTTEMTIKFTEKGDKLMVSVNFNENSPQGGELR